MHADYLSYLSLQGRNTATENIGAKQNSTHDGLLWKLETQRRKRVGNSLLLSEWGTVFFLFSMPRPYSINEDLAVPLMEPFEAPKNPLFLSEYWICMYCFCVVLSSVCSTLWHFSLNSLLLFTILQVPAICVFVIDRCLRTTYFGLVHTIRSGEWLDFLLCAVEIGDLVNGPSGSLGTANTRNVSSVVWVLRLFRLVQLRRLYEVVGFKPKFVPKTAPSITRDRVGRVWKYRVESLFSFGFLWNLTGTVVSSLQRIHTQRHDRYCSFCFLFFVFAQTWIKKTFFCQLVFVSTPMHMFVSHTLETHTQCTLSTLAGLPRVVHPVRVSESDGHALRP